ncbi:MAG: hypothetical protein ACTSU4_08835 [Promethearchaeota archaeon]
MRIRTSTIIAFIHELTHYQSGTPTQAPFALFEILILMASIPLILYFSAFLAILLFHDLTPKN